MKVKKVLALVLASAMIMGSAVTTFAAESKNVTVTVSNTYDSFYYLQIVEADPTRTDGWKYVGTYGSNFDGITVGDLVTIAKGEDSENKYATAGEINNTTDYVNSQLAEKLEAFRTTVESNGQKVDEATNFSTNKGGLYVILPVKKDYTYSPTLVYVPVNSDENITVKAKGASDKVAKELVNVTGGETVSGDETIVDGDDSVTANDTVEYKVTIKYPYFSDGASNKTFTIKDTLTNGTFLSSPAVSVTVNGAPAQAGSYSISTIDDTTTEMIVTFNADKYNPTLAGTDVVLTYSVKVNSDVSSTKPFSNNVLATIGANATQAIVKSDTVKVQFNKVDNTKVKLEGAVFALYEGDATEGNGKLIAYIADADANDSITLPEGHANAPIVNDGDKNGTLTYDGLDANKSYYVQEVVAPDGYKLNDTKYALQSGGAVTDYPKTTTEDVKGTTTTTTEYRYNDFTVVDGNEGNGIVNTKLSSLPSTGGIGTTIFTIGGCVIMISAAGLYFASRRKQENK